MSLAILFLLCSQHLSDINIYIIKSLRVSVELPHWSYCSWFDAGEAQQFVLQPATRIPLQPNNTEIPTHMEPRTIDQCGNSTEYS